jgi:CRP/FNR family cyclic AMP-dependent transcriptional regulator
MITSIPLFQGLPQESIDQLLKEAVPRTYRKGSTVIRQEDEATTLYIVQSGRLKVYRDDPGGKQFILETLSEGDHFGELALLDDKPRSASVDAIEPCVLLALSKAAFHKSLASHPGLSLQLLRSLAGEMRRLTDSLELLATQGVYGRLRALLVKEANTRDGAMVIEKPFTHQDMANRIGCTREMVSKIMSGLVIGGYLEIDTDPHRVFVRKQLPQSW